MRHQAGLQLPPAPRRCLLAGHIPRGTAGFQLQAVPHIPAQLHATPWAAKVRFCPLREEGLQSCPAAWVPACLRTPGDPEDLPWLSPKWEIMRSAGRGIVGKDAAGLHPAPERVPCRLGVATGPSVHPRRALPAASWRSSRCLVPGARLLVCLPRQSLGWQGPSPGLDGLNCAPQAGNSFPAAGGAIWAADKAGAMAHA